MTSKAIPMGRKYTALMLRKIKTSPLIENSIPEVLYDL
jgi:hypothetical protein